MVFNNEEDLLLYLNKIGIEDYYIEDETGEILDQDMNELGIFLKVN